MNLSNNRKHKNTRLGIIMICLVGMMSLTSCNRGYGCPGDNLSVKVWNAVELVFKSF